MLQLEQAIAQILSAMPTPTPEHARLDAANGRVAAEHVVAAVDLPTFDNSAMDGYAVRAADVAKASTAAPVKLRVVGKVAAGGNFTGEIASGQCVRLFTGSPIP